MTYTVSEAKNKLPDLIKRVEARDRVTITKRGIPVVEIVQARLSLSLTTHSRND